MKYLEGVIESGLFSEIDKRDYIEAFEQLKITGRTYKKNEVVFYEGDLIDKICIIREGSVRSEKVYPDGELHIVDIFDTGSIFALEVSSSRTKKAAVDYISNEESVVVFVSMHSIERNTYREEINRAMLYMLSDANIKMAHKIEILAERGLRDRIMVYLNVLRSKAGGSTVTIKMSREQLAQFLCVNRSALSNELNNMKREGIIDFKGTRYTIL
ncbi:MAG: Crp/Fnr family transcriptional regulator [Lentihominibacter sp.]